MSRAQLYRHLLGTGLLKYPKQPKRRFGKNRASQTSRRSKK